MTTDEREELRRAVVRVRLCDSHGPDAAYPDATPGAYILDCDMIVAAYLAANPADGEDPVTEEWVRAILPANGSPAPASRASASYKGAAEDLSWIDWGAAGRLCVYIGGHGIAWRAMTRRQFRALLAGLGIEAKEGT